MEKINSHLEKKKDEMFHLKIVKVETVSMDQYLSIKQPRRNELIERCSPNSLNEETDCKLLRRLAEQLFKLRGALENTWNLLPTYRPAPNIMSMLGLDVSHANTLTIEDLRNLKSDLMRMDFGINEINPDSNHIRALLGSIPADWDTNDKLTILTYLSASLTQDLNLIIKSCTPVMEGTTTDSQTTKQMTNTLNNRMRLPTEWKIREVEIWLCNLNCNPTTLRKTLTTNSEVKPTYVRLRRLPCDTTSSRQYIRNIKRFSNISPSLSPLHGKPLHTDTVKSMLRYPCRNSRAGCPIITFSQVLHSHEKHCAYPPIVEGSVISYINRDITSNRFIAFCRSFEYESKVVFYCKRSRKTIQLKGQNIRAPPKKFRMRIYDQKFKLVHRIQVTTSHRAFLVPLPDNLFDEEILYNVELLS